MDISEEISRSVRTITNFPKKGIHFKDITPILELPVLCRNIVVHFEKLLDGLEIHAIAGIESRGFLFGFPLAMELNVPFILIRKKGKLPAETISYKYALEYGSSEMEMHKGVVQKGMNVLVHDDLLATGGTAAGSAELIRMEGGNIAAFTFLIELTNLSGRQKLVQYDRPILSLADFN